MLVGCATTPGSTQNPANPEAQDAADDTPQTQLIRTGLAVARVEVTGLSCPLCAHSLTKQIQRLPAVEQIELDLGTGQLLMGLTPNTDWPSADRLFQAVHDAGFTPVSVTMPTDS